ncbi:methyltransferase domain-containing protein [Acidiphilium sp. C61]|uniref:methyltransferase domain-containing protein n=1 Tax=Acidiphilium sp. C61 TaxID=1671485 RepID=UPI001F016E20|nr:methyltransferase domain-containing protein [Acidiphilium sp. C61]
MTTDHAAMTAWAERFARATATVLPQAGDLAWLLRQSVHTHFQRLTLLPVFGLAGVPLRVLDVGAGTGAMCLDLAWATGGAARITAIDHDAHGLALLGDMAGQLGCDIETRQGDAYALPAEPQSQDLTLCRFLFQHLERPAEALREMIRVTAPGGRVVVMDVDDGAWISWPDEVPELRRLNDAVRALQASVGAGRLVGRQLYGLFRAAGLAEVQVLAVPRVRLGTSHGRSAEIEAHQKEFYLTQRDRLIAAGLIDDAGFDAAMRALDAGFAQDEFGFACEFVALGRVAAAG